MSRSPCPCLLVLAILPALLLFGGCDQAWQAYDQVKLGQPVPADNLVVRKGTTQPDQVVWGEFGGIPLPAVYGWHGVCLLTDSTGRVIAKRYEANAFGHWLVAQVLALRTVIELEVPPPSSAPDADSPRTLSHVFYVSAKLHHADPAPEREKLPIITQMLLAGSPGMMAGSRAFRVDQLMDEQESLAGLNSPGFDCRLTNRFGATARVRNLGGGIIRIEFNYIYVADPLGLIAIRQMHGE